MMISIILSVRTFTSSNLEYTIISTLSSYITVGKTMNIQRYSDDGEPQGTAGIPTLEVIKKEDLRDVVVVK